MHAEGRDYTYQVLFDINYFFKNILSTWFINVLYSLLMYAEGTMVHAKHNPS